MAEPDIDVAVGVDRRYPPAMFGVYVHVPWCRARCPYCAFDVDVRRDRPHEAFAAALLREWELRRPIAPGRPSTLYFGGGTPSLAPPGDIARIVRAVDPAPGAEITLEVNPGEIDAARLAAFRDAGVTRLSVGVQTFDPTLAARLGRRRDAAAAPAALRLAREIGFDSVSLDLLFAVPGQSRDAWRADLDAAAALGPDHVSLYGLTIEDGTAFAKGGRQPMDEDAWRERYDDAVASLAAGGWDRYEVSNFARPGHRGRHNEHYWRARPWIGLGPSAHGWWPDGTRTANVAGVTGYLAADDPLAEAAVPSPEALAWELCWSTLRHVDGLDRAVLRRWTGLDVEAPAALVRAGLLSAEGDLIRLAPDGWPLADGLSTRLAEACRPPRHDPQAGGFPPLCP